MTNPVEDPFVRGPEILPSALESTISARLAAPEFTEAEAQPALLGDEARPTVIDGLTNLLAEVTQIRASLEAARTRFVARCRIGKYVVWVVVAVATAGAAGGALDLLEFSTRVVHKQRTQNVPLTRGQAQAVIMFGVLLAGGLVIAWRWYRRDSLPAQQVLELTKREGSLSAVMNDRLDFEIDRLLRLEANRHGESTGTLVSPQSHQILSRSRRQK